jgi:hypothetical protein
MICVECDAPAGNLFDRCDTHAVAFKKKHFIGHERRSEAIVKTVKPKPPAEHLTSQAGAEQITRLAHAANDEISIEFAVEKLNTSYRSACRWRTEAVARGWAHATRGGLTCVRLPPEPEAA